jgi:hypothetical protein
MSPCQTAYAHNLHSIPIRQVSVAVVGFVAI